MNAKLVWQLDSELFKIIVSLFCFGDKWTYINQSGKSFEPMLDQLNQLVRYRFQNHDLLRQAYLLLIIFNYVKKKMMKKRKTQPLSLSFSAPLENVCIRVAPCEVMDI